MQSAAKNGDDNGPLVDIDHFLDKTDDPAQPPAEEEEDPWSALSSKKSKKKKSSKKKTRNYASAESYLPPVEDAYSGDAVDTSEAKPETHQPDHESFNTWGKTAWNFQTWDKRPAKVPVLEAADALPPNLIEETFQEAMPEPAHTLAAEEADEQVESLAVDEVEEDAVPKQAWLPELAEEPEPESHPGLSPTEARPAEELPFVWGSFPDDTVASAEPNRSKPSPVPTPTTLRSPRHAPAKPVVSSMSPPRRPINLYDPAKQYGNAAGFRANSTSPAVAPPRRSSTATSPRPRLMEPPLPHMPQAHFFGLPSLGLDFGLTKDSTSGKPAGSDGYCCVFDSFADCGDAVSSRKVKDAVLAGSEGALDVYRVFPDRIEVVGRLEGLRGSVVGAKLLSHTSRNDGLRDLRPLVAVIVHGAVAVDGRDPTSSGHYTTSVEIYSLQTQRQLTTLYSTAPVKVEQPSIGHLTSLPGPIGDLSVHARGKFVVVASGKSGEIFVFTAVTNGSHPKPEFRCLGKYWTSVQSSLSSETSRPSSALDGSQNSDEPDEKLRVPLLSLSQRWLAVVWPSVSLNSSLRGFPLLSDINPNPPGLASHSSGPQPAVTCDIVGVDAEGTLSRMTRQAAQGIVKYSQKGIEIGWQSWKELTNPTPQSGPQSHGRTGSREYDLFPPTNAPTDDARRLASEPAVVSIIDLELLLEAEELKPKYPPAPLTTFALTEGCNFLSFSSNGLRILTASRKGEVAAIWDLTQASYGTTSLGKMDVEDSATGPCVKQIARFPRSSQSLVVDGIWSRDDDLLAIRTAHGTVHLHEVPMYPPSRKRKRKSLVSAPATDKADATVSLSQGVSPPSTNGFLGSIRSGWQQMSTQVNTIRSQNPASGLGIPTTFAGFKEATATAGQAGGRLVAKGISQGYTAAKGGASDYWHAEDNKIRHKALLEQARKGSVRWIHRQSGTLLAVACGGSVHLHPVSRLSRRKGAVIVTGLKHEKAGQKHFKLQLIKTSDDVGPADTAEGNAKKDDCSAEGPHGFWTLRSSLAVDGRRTSLHRGRPMPPQASDFETNPPFCPFHVDSRVNILAFDDADPFFPLYGHGFEDDGPWIFGESLPPCTKMNTHDSPDDNHHDSDLDEIADQMESRLTVHAASESRGEQIRIDTRRSTTMKGSLKDRRTEGEFEMLHDGGDYDYDDAEDREM